jgi:hypothetical protein
MLIRAESLYVLNIAAGSPSSAPSIVVNNGYMRFIETLNHLKQSGATDEDTTRAVIYHTIAS